jgi:hypothetical protein
MEFGTAPLLLHAAIAEASLNQHCAEKRNPAIAIGSMLVARTNQGFLILAVKR